VLKSNIVKNWQKKENKSYVIELEATKKFWRFDMGEHSFALTPRLNKILENITIGGLKQRPNISCQAVKKAAAKFWHVNEENIAVSSGSDQLIWLIPRLFMNPSDFAITLNPTFFLFTDAVIRAGGKIVAVGTNNKENFKFTDRVVNSLISLAKQKQVKIIWLCNPNNPTGEVLSLAQIKKIIKNTQALVIVDEVFFEISDLPKNESAINLITQNNKLIVLKSLSKAHGLMGVRVGFGIASKKIVNLLENWRLPFSISIFAQKVAIVLLNDNQHFKKIKQEIKKERAWLFKGIKQFENLQLAGESKTTVFLLRHKKKDLFEELFKRRVLGADFRNTAGIEGQGFIRLTLQDRRKNKILLNALSKV
jgi:histidinol-phosphate aminotransferase